MSHEGFSHGPVDPDYRDTAEYASRRLMLVYVDYADTFDLGSLPEGTKVLFTFFDHKICSSIYIIHNDGFPAVGHGNTINILGNPSPAYLAQIRVLVSERYWDAVPADKTVIWEKSVKAFKDTADKLQVPNPVVIMNPFIMDAT